MQYHSFGSTGLRESALGFGAMRLPVRPENGQNVVDEDASIALIRRGFELGVNYVDTAYMYMGHKSEGVVGKALKGWRDRITLSTKLPLWDVKTTADFRRFLEEQLQRLDTTHIDFYHFHGLNLEKWNNTVLPLHLLKEMERARSEGLIRFMSFSFHDQPAVMKTFIDTGLFASVLCQYNLLDRSNEEMIAYAHEKGLGTVIMGPVAGGRLGDAHEDIQKAIPGRRTTPEIALRFVLANPNVDIALSGMSSLAQLEQNVLVASDPNPLSPEEVRQVKETADRLRELANLYCTGCEYCMPCPNEVNIAACFKSKIDLDVYHFQESAVKRYRAIGDPWIKGKRADACVNCGLCEPKCPQKIPIRDQLRETAARFSALMSGG